MLFALNHGEVCTCQPRLLIQEDIYDQFMEKVVARTEAIVLGDPLDPVTMMGAQVSLAQHDRIVEYINIGVAEGAKVLTGGSANDALSGGHYIKPTIVGGTNDMRVFQEEIFGPVTSATTFKTVEDAVEIANDTECGLGAGVWTRDMHQAYQVPRAIQAGRVWVNCYHAYPAGAPFGGYKKSGFGRETHKMMLNSYRQTKNMIISYDHNKLVTRSRFSCLCLSLRFHCSDCAVFSAGRVANNKHLVAIAGLLLNTPLDLALNQRSQTQVCESVF